LARPATARASDSTRSTAARVISFRHSFIHSLVALQLFASRNVTSEGVRGGLE